MMTISSCKMKTAREVMAKVVMAMDDSDVSGDELLGHITNENQLTGGKMVQKW